MEDAVQIDVDGYVDEKGIRYIGRATRQPDGMWICLADVGGCLCRVEVKIRRCLADYSTKELETELLRRERAATMKPVPVVCAECRYPAVAHGRNIYACGQFKHPMTRNPGDTL